MLHALIAARGGPVSRATLAAACDRTALGRRWRRARRLGFARRCLEMPLGRRVRTTPSSAARLRFHRVGVHESHHAWVDAIVGVD
jgi:hypothetical protein